MKKVNPIFIKLKFSNTRLSAKSSHCLNIFLIDKQDKSSFFLDISSDKPRKTGEIELTVYMLVHKYSAANVTSN